MFQLSEVIDHEVIDPTTTAQILAPHDITRTRRQRSFWQICTVGESGDGGHLCLGQ